MTSWYTSKDSYNDVSVASSDHVFCSRLVQKRQYAADNPCLLEIMLGAFVAAIPAHIRRHFCGAAAGHDRLFHLNVWRPVLQKPASKAFTDGDDCRATRYFKLFIR